MANLNQSGIFYFQNQGAATLKVFPTELRRSLASSIEPRFTGLFAGIGIVAFVIVWILSHQPVVETVTDKDIQRIQERYAQLVLNQPKPKVEEVKKEEKSTVSKSTAETKGEETKEEVKVDRTKEAFVDKQKRREASVEDRRQRRDAISKQVASAGIFAAITSSGGGSGGSSDVNDLLGATDVVSGLSGISVSKGTFATRKVDAAELTARRGGQTGEVGIQTSGVGKAAVKQIAAAGNVNITSEPPQIKGDETQVQTSQACIQRVVTRESSRIKRVYENWLKRDPQLSGNMKIKFTILPAGAVSNVTVVQSTTGNTEFDQNIVRYIQRWDFSACSPSSPLEIVVPFGFVGQS